MNQREERRIFLAGASGAIGRQLVPLLRANGWKVLGSTRSDDKLPLLKDMGIEGVVVDVFHADKLCAVLGEFRPDTVIHQLTDLPYALEASQMQEASVRNARLREVGTRNLVDASIRAGAKRLIAQSISFVYDEGVTPHREDDPLLPDDHPTYGQTSFGVKCLEREVLQASADGIVLRYGLLYGPGTGFDTAIAPGSVHVAAAAKAAELAVTRGSRGIYNVAEEDGSVVIEKATRLLGWSPDWRN